MGDSTLHPGVEGSLRRPKNVVVILLDSLRRDALSCYGGVHIDTPVLDRLAAESLRFQRHVVGSLPCMPARHDLLCGAYDFLWKPWGSVEIWEEPITAQLRRRGVTTMLVTDHPHLFESGGENYHCEFTGWEYLRGHESDPWRTVADPTWTGTPALPARVAPRHARPADLSRTWFRDEAEFPGPRTMEAAATWLEREATHHDRFFLFIDEFDPHEPFDTPARWANRYDPDWEGERIIWPPYAVGAQASGSLSSRDARHIQANYAAKVSMIDHWLGRVLHALDRSGMADDTAVVLCTDHGHYLGDPDAEGADIWGKPATPIRPALGHTPLLIRWPGQRTRDIDALTTNVDIHATLCELFDAAPEHRTHGRSMIGLIEGDSTAIREHAIFGYWGREVHITNGDTVYVRSPHTENAPLSMWSNRWSTMPVHSMPDLRLPRPDGRAWLDRMPGSSVPVIRQPFDPGDPIPFWGYGVQAGNHSHYDLVDGSPAEGDLIEALEAALLGVEAPAEQLTRLGLG